MTYDVGTIPAILYRRLAEGQPIPGVALVPVRAIAQDDIGSIIRALVRLHDDPSVFDSDHPIVYLQRTR